MEKTGSLIVIKNKNSNKFIRLKDCRLGKMLKLTGTNSNKPVYENDIINSFQSYAKHKNYAKGLGDLSLLTANISQLAKVVKTSGHVYLIVILGLSILLQVLYKSIQIKHLQTLDGHNIIHTVRFKSMNPRYNIRMY